MAIDKNTVMKEAQKFASKGQFDKAIAEWKKLLRESPADPNIYNTIGDLCLKKDAKTEAVEAYKKAADILAEDGFTSKAIALYKKVLNIDPNKIEIHLSLGDLNAEKGLTSAALESYKLVLDHYTNQKNMQKALGIYQKMADLNPSNLAFRVKLGDMYAKEGLKAEAAAAYLAVADVQVSNNAFQEARQLFEKILTLDPENREVYHKAGFVYFKEGKFVEACKALKPAFENDPSNKELADMYLEALSKANKHAEAEEVLLSLATADPDRTEFRDKLCQLYLAQKEYDKALREASALAYAKAEHSETEAAEHIFRAFVSQCPSFGPAHEKLSEFYSFINRPDNAAKELVQAALLYEKEGDPDHCKALLYQALEAVPGLPDATKHLERLAASAKVSAAPAMPEPVQETPVAVPDVAPPVAAPEPVFEAQPPSPDSEAIMPEEPPAVNEAFTEADVLIKYGLPAKAADQLEELAVRYPGNTRIHLKLRDLYAEQGNSEKSVQHMIILSDLYAQQGKPNQAQAELQAAHEKDPRNPIVLTRLGITAPPAVEEVSLPESIPDQFDIAPSAPPAAPPPVFEETPPPFAPALVDDGNIVFEGLDSQISAAEDAAAMPQQAFEEQFQPSGEVLPAEEEPAAPFPPEEGPASFGVASAPEAPVQEQQPEPAGEPELTEIAQQPSSFQVQAEKIPESDLADIWAEAEFYYQQGLFDEARKYYAKIIELAPSDRRAINRLAEISREEDETKEFSRLAEAVEGLEDTVVPTPSERALATSVTDEEAVRSLMTEIAEMNKKLKQAKPTQPSPSKPETAKKQKPASVPRSVQPGHVETAPKQKPAPPYQPPTPQITEHIRRVSPPPKQPAAEKFFDLEAFLQQDEDTSKQKQRNKSDDYFDLAAELRDEINSVSLSSPQASLLPENQSLDDIFEEFKKGVEQHTVKEDTDTHYNLGVAYKEMGLLDDAIAEFVLTPRGGPWFFQSRYLLGLCYLEKNDYQNAITEFRNALNAPANQQVDVQERISVRYDLALAHQGVGNTKAAISEFQEIINANPGYRDAAEKLKELRQGESISLRQLKDDIEKEISAKFLREGERIEREEKSKKIIKS